MSDIDRLYCSLCVDISFEFVKISEQIKEVLALDEQIHGFAEALYQQMSLLIMGRGYNYATCLEGALVGILCVCLAGVLFVLTELWSLEAVLVHALLLSDFVVFPFHQ